MEGEEFKRVRGVERGPVVKVINLSSSERKGTVFSN